MPKNVGMFIIVYHYCYLARHGNPRHRSGKRGNATIEDLLVAVVIDMCHTWLACVYGVPETFVLPTPFRETRISHTCVCQSIIYHSIISFNFSSVNYLSLSK